MSSLCLVTPGMWDCDNAGVAHEPNYAGFVVHCLVVVSYGGSKVKLGLNSTTSTRLETHLATVSN